MNTKIFVLPNGRVFAVDPSLDDLPLFKKLNPNFKIEELTHPSDFTPNLKKLTEWGLGSKIKQAGEILKSCTLCFHKCRINRLEKTGRCGLRERAFLSSPFIHISQEKPINPTATLKLFGCSLKCAYCISSDHIESLDGMPELVELSPDAWGLIELDKANCLEFAGGNPTESIPAVLEFLSRAPKNFNLPIVWNDHLFSTPDAINLLDGIVDVYIADFKFGSDACARKLSQSEKYWEGAQDCLKEMMKQEARIILRILIIPNHFNCCQKKILSWLSQFKDRIWVSILNQYIPSYKSASDPGISRLVKREEVQAVETLVKEFGFRDVNKSPENFWR